MHVFIAVEFRRAKNVEVPKCPLSREQVSRMWHINTIEVYMKVKRT